jgi:CRISPR/Cas system type I-B associated protein Csh2 (Cas7 group RAMP superfamily)
MGDPTGYGSAVILTEMLTRPKQVGDVALERAYRRLLTNSRNFTLVPIDAAVADDAAGLRARLARTIHLYPALALDLRQAVGQMWDTGKQSRREASSGEVSLAAACARRPCAWRR